MNKTFRTIASVIGMICVFVLVITGIIKFYQFMIPDVPDTIIKINSDVSIEEVDLLDYPKKVTFQYHLTENSPLIDKHMIYAISSDENANWNVTIFKKSKNGYVAEYGEDKDFSVNDLKKFGYRTWFKATAPNGEFSITFRSRDDWEEFMDKESRLAFWEEAYLHMAEKKRDDAK